MARDPLSFFANEKVASASAPDTPVDEFHQIAKRPSSQSLDPGERALAGMAAVSGSLISKIVPWAAEAVLSDNQRKGDVAFPRPGGFGGATSFGELLRKDFDPPKSRIMGLFDVTARTPSREEWFSKKMEGDRLNFARRVKEIEDVADSFIDKHHLKEKGVTIHTRQGPISGTVTGAYSPTTKKLFIPHLGKASVMHELGHAADYTTRMGRIRAAVDPVIKKSVLFALPVALAAGDQVAEIIPGTIDDKAIKFMQDNAPEIMGATLAATTLYPEAKASLLAVKHVAEKQGPVAARAMMKKLGPSLGSYVIGAIPAIIGMSLARKYMRQARSEKGELKSEIDEMIGDLEKKGSLSETFVHHGKDISHVARGIAKGTAELISEPGTMRRIVHAAREVGTSPEFVHGAVATAVPATLAALYMYGTPSGEITRKRMHQAQIRKLPHEAIVGPQLAAKEGWREQHPLRFAGLVALGTAMAGGIMTKFIRDLAPIL